MHAERLLHPQPIERGPLTGGELPDPLPGDDELLLEVEACALCRTDLQLCEGDLAPRRLPIIPGHQVVGRVIALGARAEGWELGDRAGIGWLAGACGACPFCESSRENLCTRAQFTGWDRDGGYAERTTARADFALPLPNGIPAPELAPLLCGGVIGYRALRLSGIEPGGRLGLFGFGASAFLAIQVALHWECEVYVVTRSGEEQDRARQLGAEWAGSYDDQPPELLDAAVTFAPVGEVVVAALAALDRGGTVAINAIHLDRVPEFSYDKLWWERRIRSVANYTRNDAREFLQLAEQIPIHTSIDEYPLAAANTALGDLKAGQVSGAGVLLA
jgi:propanol-preferring alcohol dehydrogenase